MWPESSGLHCGTRSARSRTLQQWNNENYAEDVDHEAATWVNCNYKHVSARARSYSTPQPDQWAGTAPWPWPLQWPALDQRSWFPSLTSAHWPLSFNDLHLVTDLDHFSYVHPLTGLDPPSLSSDHRPWPFSDLHLFPNFDPFSNFHFLTALPYLWRGDLGSFTDLCLAFSLRWVCTWEAVMVTLPDGCLCMGSIHRGYSDVDTSRKAV